MAKKPQWIAEFSDGTGRALPIYSPSRRVCCTEDPRFSQIHVQFLFIRVHSRSSAVLFFFFGCGFAALGPFPLPWQDASRSAGGDSPVISVAPLQSQPPNSLSYILRSFSEGGHSLFVDLGLLRNNLILQQHLHPHKALVGRLH